MSDNEEVNQDALGDDWAAALEEQDETESANADATAVAEDSSIQSAQMSDLEAESGPGFQSDDKLDVILEIPVTMSMEIGRTRISIRNLLQLNQGSVVELDRLAGEPMDVLINGTLIAHGEVVVVNEKFGIRLTDIISPSERVKKLA